MNNKSTVFLSAFLLTFFAIVLVAKITTAIYSDEEQDRLEIQQSVRILKNVHQFFATTGSWDQRDDRICVSSDRMSLFCALAKTSRATTGTYDHRNSAMIAVRQCIEMSFSTRWAVHPIMDFNNHAETTRDDLLRVLEESIEYLEAK